MVANNDVDDLCARYLDKMEQVYLTSDEIRALPDNISSYRGTWRFETLNSEPPMFSRWRNEITLHQPELGQPYELLDGLGRVQEAIQSGTTDLLTFRVVKGTSETELLGITALLHCGNNDKKPNHQGLHLANAFKDDYEMRRDPKAAQELLELMAKIVGQNKDHIRKMEKVVQAGLYQCVVSRKLTSTFASTLIQPKHAKTLADFKAGKITQSQAKQAVRRTESLERDQRAETRRARQQRPPGTLRLLTEMLAEGDAPEAGQGDGPTD